MAFADALPEHLVRLFARSLTVTQFRQWFSRAWWAAESSAPEDLFAFATTIEHLTYILDDGVWDEVEFRRRLLEEALLYYGTCSTLTASAPHDLRSRTSEPWDEPRMPPLAIRYRDGAFTISASARAA